MPFAVIDTHSRYKEEIEHQADGPGCVPWCIYRFERRYVTAQYERGIIIGAAGLLDIKHQFFRQEKPFFRVHLTVRTTAKEQVDTCV